MVNENAENTDTSEDCLKQCNSDSSCKYWDINNDGVCRLRSDEGSKGPVETIGSSYGQKYCIFSKTVLKELYPSNISIKFD